jgi:hypothetical protein
MATSMWAGFTCLGGQRACVLTPAFTRVTLPAAPLQITPLKGAVSWQASLARLVQFQLPSTRLFRQWCRTGWQLLTRRGPRALLRGMYETWLIQTTAARTGQPPYADWFKAFAQPDAAQMQAMAQAARSVEAQAGDQPHHAGI